MASTNIQTFPGKVGVSNTNPIHTLDIGSNVYIDDTAQTKLRIIGNIHASGVTVDGTITTIDSENLSVKDPIILLASGSTGTSDTGIIMKRADGDSNVAVFYDEGVGLKIGHTLSTAQDIHISVDSSNSLSTSIYGPVTVAHSSAQALVVQGGAEIADDFKVGASKLFVDVSESNVGIGTDAPLATLDVHGTANVGALTVVSISGDGSALSSIQSSNVSDFASNVTRIGTLETDLTSNVTRITDLESSDMTIGGEKTFSSNLELSKATGSATISPTELRLTTTTNAADWDTTNSWARLAFYTNDITGDAPGVMASVGAVASSVDGGENTRLAFFTAEPHLERMCVDRYGNVGIGTTSPIAALDIVGGAEDDTTPALSIRGGIHDTSDLYVLNTYGTNIGVGYAAKVIGVNIKNKVETNNTIQVRNNIGGLTAAGAIYLGSDDVNQGIFGVLGADGVAGTTLTERLTVRAGGNVGIGTTSPSAPLHVQGAQSIFGNNGGASGIVINDIPQARWKISTGGYALTFNKHNSASDEYSTWSEKVRIDQNGNVGIGTASPGHKLHVYGDANGIDLGPIAAMGIVDSGVSFCGIKVGQKVSVPYSRTALSVEDNGVSILHADAHNRRVGIGTVGPRASLDIGGSTFKYGYEYRYQHAWTSNNNQTFTIPVTGATARGEMIVEAEVIQVASNSSAERLARIKGIITNYHTGNFYIKLFEGTNVEAFETYVVGTSALASGTFTLKYRPEAGYLQSVVCRLNLKIFIGGYTSYLGSLTRTDNGSNSALTAPTFDTAPHSFGGNVGIGVANPQAPLTIFAKKGSILASSLDSLSSNATIRINGYAEAVDQLAIGLLGTDTVGDGGNNGVPYLQSMWDTPSTGRDLLLNPAGGNIGIGTTSPLYPLTVAGSAGAMPAMKYFNSGSTNIASGANDAITIYAAGNIYASGLIAASDKRIKKNIVDADDAECLETLRLLKPKKYEYRDAVARGEEPVWGFIAQEVRETLQYATKLGTDVTPNIYELANVSSSNVITFVNFNTSNLESNTTTLIRTKGIDGKDHDIHLVEVVDEHTIRVEEDLSLWTGSVDAEGNVFTQIETTTLTPEEYEALEDKTGCVANISGYQNANVVISVEEYNGVEDTTGYEEVIENYTKTATIYPGTQLFVYGQEVDDFIFVKKEAIWTVATAALQEVDRQLQDTKAQLASVLARLDALENP